MNDDLSWGAEPEEKGWQGLNNAAINAFNSNVINSFVREMFQNSIDARNSMIARKGEDGKNTKIRLRKFSIPKDDFPNFSDFRKKLNLVSQSGPNKKHEKFFNNIFSEIDSGKEITLFGFEDYNTPGLTGDDDDPESTFSACVLSEGTSVDKSDTAGGSYGIGKNAIFGFSKARTVFFSSLSPKGEYIFQGLSKLASFKDENGKQFKYRIYCGEGKNQRSVRDSSHLPEGFKQIIDREEPGLSQYAVSPILKDSWEEEYVKAIIRNYWMLIANNDLEVEIIVDGKITYRIDKTNFEELLYKFFNPETYEPDNVKPEGNPYDFYMAYKNVDPIEKEVKGIGTVKFHCLELDHKQTNKIAFQRNGMTIFTDHVWGFGSIGYCGVLYCTNKLGNVELRNMEPPTHDSFDPGRLDERSKKLTAKDGESILSALKKIIREPLKEILDRYKEPAEDIPWLDDLLESLLGQKNSGLGKRTGESSQRETTQKISQDIDVSVHFKSKEGSTLINNDSGDKESEGGGLGQGSGGGKRGGKQKNKKKKKMRKGGGPYGGKKTKKSEIDFRIYKTNNKNKIKETSYNEYKVILKSIENAQVNDIMISQKGDSGDIIDFSLGKVINSEGSELSFKPVKNKKGEQTAYVIENVEVPTEILMYVNEPYKSSFKIIRA